MDSLHHELDRLEFKSYKVYWYLFVSIAFIISCFFVTEFSVDQQAVAIMAKHKTLGQFIGDGVSIYRVHFSPILYLTYIASNDFELLLCKCFLLLVSLFILYKTVRNAYLFVFLTTIPAFLLTSLNTGIHFYEVFFALPMILVAFYFFSKGRIDLGLIIFSLTFLVKEEFPLIGMGVGVWIYLENKQKKYLLYSLFSVAMWALIVKVIQPLICRYLGYDGSHLVFSRYGHLGSSFSEMLKTIIFHPIHAFITPHTFQKSVFFVVALYPLCFLKKVYFYRGLALLAVPLLYSWLSTNFYGGNILYMHYAVPVYALIMGLFIYYQSDMSTSSSDHSKIRLEWMYKAFVINGLFFLVFFLYSIKPLRQILGLASLKTFACSFQSFFV